MYCKQCGKEVGDREAGCTPCATPAFGSPVVSPPPVAPPAIIPPPMVPPQMSSEPDASMRWLMPVGRSGYAIAAGYLGLFALIPVFAPFALVFGIIAVIDIKRHKEKHGMGRAIFGIVMGVIFTILLLLLVYALVFK